MLHVCQVKVNTSLHPSAPSPSRRVWRFTDALPPHIASESQTSRCCVVRWSLSTWDHGRRYYHCRRRLLGATVIFAAVGHGSAPMYERASCSFCRAPVYLFDSALEPSTFATGKDSGASPFLYRSTMFVISLVVCLGAMNPYGKEGPHYSPYEARMKTRDAKRKEAKGVEAEYRRRIHGNLSSSSTDWRPSVDVDARDRPMGWVQRSSREERLVNESLRASFTAFCHGLSAALGLAAPDREPVHPCSWCGFPTTWWCALCTTALASPLCCECDEKSELGCRECNVESTRSSHPDTYERSGALHPLNPMGGLPELKSHRLYHQRAAETAQSAHTSPDDRRATITVPSEAMDCDCIHETALCIAAADEPRYFYYDFAGNNVLSPTPFPGQVYAERNARIPARPSRPVPQPETTKEWKICPEDFTRLPWWIQLEAAEPVVVETTVEDSNGNFHPGTYVAWWFGQATHSRALWRNFFPGESYPQEAENPAAYLNTDTFSSWIRTLKRDASASMLTEHGVHASLMYCGPLDATGRDKIQRIMSDVLAEYKRCRHMPHSRVGPMMKTRRHWVLDPGLTPRIEPRIEDDARQLDLSEESREGVIAWLNADRIDVSEYEGDAIEQKVRFLEWWEREVTTRRLVQANASILEMQGYVQEAENDWSLVQYKVPGSTSVYGTEIWDLCLYTKRRLLGFMYHLDSETGKPYMKSKKGHHVLSDFALHVSPPPTVLYATAAGWQQEGTPMSSRAAGVLDRSSWATRRAKDKASKSLKERLTSFADKVEEQYFQIPSPTSKTSWTTGVDKLFDPLLSAADFTLRLAEHSGERPAEIHNALVSPSNPETVAQ